MLTPVPPPPPHHYPPPPSQSPLTTLQPLEPALLWMPSPHPHTDGKTDAYGRKSWTRMAQQMGDRAQKRPQWVWCQTQRTLPYTVSRKIKPNSIVRIPEGQCQSNSLIRHIPPPPSKESKEVETEEGALDGSPKRVGGGPQVVAQVSGMYLDLSPQSAANPLTPRWESIREHREEPRRQSGCLLLGEPAPAFLEWG